MFGECHAHMIMDGVNYKKAVALHAGGVQDAPIKEKLECYRKRNITFVRDGGDAFGVSARAAELAPEYGITYRTPLFAIHKKGHYGGIVGLAFTDWKEYRELVLRVRAQGGHFIKVMCSGIMDFEHHGQVTEPPLSREEIREMIHIAHEEGFAVMAHVNGATAIKHALEAGVDSIEHGNFMDEEALKLLVGSQTVWVPTYVTITNLIGSGRFDDRSLMQLKQEAGERIRRGFELGVRIALGSDAGAYRVFHGQGATDEYRQLCALMTEETPQKAGSFRLTREELDRRLRAGEEEIRRRF